MAETPLPPAAEDTVEVSLNPESTPAEIEHANARANNREPRPVPGSDTDAPTEDALPQDADLDDSADDSVDDAPQDEETQRPRMPRRVKQALDQRDAARQALDAEREYRIRLEERLAALERQLPQEEPAAPDVSFPQPQPQPVYEDYASEEEYFKAMAEWGRSEALREVRAELAQQREHDQTVQAETASRQEAVDRHTRAINAARQNHADFDTAIRSIPEVSQTLMEAFQHLEHSGEVLYHLATNPQELATLNGTSNPLALGAALQALDQRFSPSDEPTDEPEPEPDTPRARGLPPLNGATDGDAAAYNPYDHVGSQEDYRTWYDKQFGPKGG